MKTVLFVDDDIELTALINASLSKDYRVFTAHNGEQALEILKKNTPDIIITDVLMPRMNGYQLYQAIRKLRSDLHETPIAVISSRASMRDLFEDSSIACFLTKPFTNEQLLEMISNVLNGKSAFGKTRQTASNHVVIAGVDQYAIKTLTTYLKSQNFLVDIGLDEDDTCKLVSKIEPNLVLCQYWEDHRVFDAIKIHKTLDASAKTNRIPFTLFCVSALALEAAKSLKIAPQEIMTYEDSGELIRKTSALLATLTLVR